MGYEPRALHLRLFRGARAKEAEEAARRAARFLSVPFEVLDLEEEFERRIIGYFVKAYGSGLTPNPCVVCNAEIKIPALLRKAGSASYIATGHYAKVEEEPGLGRVLKRGLDPVKEQSYFLQLVPRASLQRLLLPLGGSFKEEVRGKAGDLGIPFLEKESQDVCFIQGDYRGLLRERGVEDQGPGPIKRLRDGTVLGSHKGLYHYTVGQRRGLGIPGKEPYYVARLALEENALYVGTKEEILRRRLRLARVNWLIEPKKAAGKRLLVRIRYRHKGVGASLLDCGGRTAVLEVEAPGVEAPPGQFACLYLGDIVLGGGEIQP